jgi:4-hydroxy-2-oxoheptanedioate aldolase
MPSTHVRRSIASVRRAGTVLVRSAFMLNKSLGERLRGGETLYGGWTVIADVIAVGAMAASGLDYVVIDLQHGGATEHDLPALTTAISRAGATPVARVRHAHPADIGRALDLGCAGVVVPNVESAEQALAVVGACHYPPTGYRSAGGALVADEEPFCVIMVESSAALADLEATLAVPGVDGIYVGPRDLSYSLGGELNPEDPVLRPALERVWAACRSAGKPSGVHSADGTTARLYRENGCRLVNVVADAPAIARTAATELAVARPPA